MISPRLVSQVNGNGVLSFARAMHRFFNIAFPLDDPVIAPLYTHVDTRGSGRVYYVETDAAEVLARAGAMVRSAFTDAADFVPSHVFVATWVDVGYYNGKSDKVSRSKRDEKSFPRIDQDDEIEIKSMDRFPTGEHVSGGDLVEWHALLRGTVVSG